MNDIALSPDTLLEYYKGQGVVERGFRFLKDKSFRVSEGLSQKNSRIQALAMIMVLCLFIYSMVEFRLRQLWCHWRCKSAHFRRDKKAQLTTFKQVLEGSGDAENGGLSDATRSLPPGDDHQSNLPGDRV